MTTKFSRVQAYTSSNRASLCSDRAYLRHGDRGPRQDVHTGRKTLDKKEMKKRYTGKDESKALLRRIPARWMDRDFGPNSVEIALRRVVIVRV
jgi:hypothetical protein